MKLALRGLAVVAIAALVTQVGTAASAQTRLVVWRNAFVMWNAHDGLLGTETCKRNGGCVGGAVERTSDGGRTYHVVLRTPHGIDSLQTIGRNGAIATTGNERTWRTLDGGTTWQQVPNHPVVNWLNPRLGIRFRYYMAGNVEKQVMLVTHDGGHSWGRRRNPCRKAPDFNAMVDLVSPRRWWVACLGQGAAGSEEKAILRTRDGGSTWHIEAEALVYPKARQHGGLGIFGYPNGMAFARDGWGLLTEDRGTLYVTRDGGTHFHAKPRVMRPEMDFAGGVAAFPGGRGFVLMRIGARLIETRDYGRTWHVVRRWRS